MASLPHGDILSIFLFILEAFDFERTVILYFFIFVVFRPYKAR